MIDPLTRRIAAAALLAGLLSPPISAFAQQRCLGLDISAWQGNLSTTVWATFKRATSAGGDGRDFVLLRSSRGGTTGYYDQNDSANANGKNDYSQRYDDPYYVQNINRATSAGLFAGTYHFARPDIIETTLNAHGIANTGPDEADHMIQMAGPWMRPGYMLPVLDLEAGASQHTTAELSTFSVAFSDRIYQQMGIRPMIYVNSSYANSEVNSTVVASMPARWIARPSTGDPLTTEPPAATGYPNVYGVWNPSYPTIPTPQPWKFWQYNTGTGLVGYTGNIDKDAANGGMEFLKDYLIPALWVTNSDGQWTTLLNWNSGQTPVAPIQGTNQVARVGTLTLPTPRLPGANDTVTLDRPSANITVTLTNGAQTIRKLYMREILNLTGGSLTINYVPSADSTPIAAQFSGPVTLSGSASLSVHTLQVDATRTFTLNGGTLTFKTIILMPNSTTPAKIALGGDMSFNALTSVTATITNGTGAGSPGLIDLGGGARAWNVAKGSAAVDLSIDVPVSNGALSKTGLGTMRLGIANSYNGGTTISAGTLEGAVPGSIPGNVTNNAGTLKLDSATAMASGATLALANAPSAGAANLNFSGAQTISSLCFGTTRKAAGTWATSGATHNNPAFAGSGILNVTTGPASITSVTRTSGFSPAAYGSSLSFTATVTGNSPAGNVQFKVDGVAAGSPVALVGGSAPLTLSTLSVSGSPHQITAYYSGDDNNNPSDNSASPASQTITALTTSCSLAASVNPSAPGTNVTFTAAVTPVPPSADLPTGSVVFSANRAPFATNALLNGNISASTTSLPPGTNTITAQYLGGENFLGSTGGVTQVVKLSAACSQTNTLLSLADNPNGTSTLTFVGTPQAQYYVLASPDVAAPMTSWTPVAGSTNTVTNVSGLWQFTVTNTAPRQFYRGRAVLPCP